jgi:Ser/Thr protein kinase RdoA (MazF antagonist)
VTAHASFASAGDREFLRAVAAETGLSTPTRPFPLKTAAQLVFDHYGLSGQLTRIPTEKDDTFGVDTETGKYLVKISPPGESPGIVNLQTAAMLHIRERVPQLPVQAPVAGTDGSFEFPVRDADSSRVLRVLTFLPGKLLSQAHPSPPQVHAIGAMLARIAAALRDFTHPCQDRLLIWDIQQFHRMRPLLDYVEDKANVSLARRIFDQFDDQVRPQLPSLARQVVHADFSPYNLLVDDEGPGYVRGVIDFGDVVRTAVVFDIAVAMANLLGTGPGSPWDPPIRFLNGYLSVRPVPATDLDVLSTAAQARLLLRALMAHWQAVENPARRDYLLSHSGRDWVHLARAQDEPAHSVSTRFKALRSRHWPADNSSQRRS